MLAFGEISSLVLVDKRRGFACVKVHTEWRTGGYHAVKGSITRYEIAKKREREREPRDKQI